MKQNMMRVALSLVVASAAVAGLWSDEPAKPKEPAKPAEKTDMLAEAQSWNSDKFMPPPTQFRTGNVTPRVLDAKAVKTLEKGFEISLPSGAPVPTPTVYKGKLYVSGGFHSKEFYCFDATDGKFVWGINLDDDGPTSAVCDDGVTLFNTESCTLFAVDSATGKHLWSYWLGDPLTSTPTVANGKVFTSYPARGGGGQMNQAPNAAGQKPAEGKQPEKAKAHPPCSHVLAAFDLKTGKILWQRWLDSDVMSAPVAVEKELYVTSFAGIVYKFNQEDGKLLSAVKSRATSAPVVVGNNVYMTQRADDGKGNAKEAIAAQGRNNLDRLYQANSKDAPYLDEKVQKEAKLAGEAKSLDAGNGFPAMPAAANGAAAAFNVGQGNVSTMQAFQGSRILNMGERNFNCMGDEVVCTDPKSGNCLWSYKLPGDVKKEGGFLAAPPAAAGGQLFLVTLNGDVLQMDPKDGKITQKHKVGHQTRFQPAIEGGKIYVGTQNGKVVSLDAGDTKFTGWPCWGGNAAHTGLPGDLLKK